MSDSENGINNEYCAGDSEINVPRDSAYADNTPVSDAEHSDGIEEEQASGAGAEHTDRAGKEQVSGIGAEHEDRKNKKQFTSADSVMSGEDEKQPDFTEHPKKKRTGAARILLFIIISLVIGFTVYRWNAERLAGNAMPMPFGFGMSVVLSGSMEPELSVNDLVIIAKSDSYETGDTVVYQSQGDLIIHKIIETDGMTAVTQGTANNIPDEPIQVEAIKGKLVMKLPKVGIAVRGIRTPIGVVVILAAALLLLGRSYRNEKARDDAELEAIKAEIRRLRGE